MLFKLTVILLLLLLTLSAAKEVPSEFRKFYDTVRKGGSCTGRDLLQGGFFDHDGPTLPLWGYCQRYMNDQGFYIKGPGNDLANMDVDCDGQNVQGDGRCANSPDVKFETAFKDDVQAFGIPDLNSYIHPYVVLGNIGRYYPTFDPQSVGVQPLSVVAVICGDKLIYGIWGDMNGDDGLPLVGEVSLALATECFGGSMDGNNGYDGEDVLYISFKGDGAVPGEAANWKAATYGDFERSIEDLGDELMSGLVSAFSEFRMEESHMGL
ncbi:chitosanase [Aspergillus cavernicola]|uniref:Endo-chitosanase n=1 Tax=Aspergillus cavernicola TaxID=176166 RepID=A0ABR4HXX9_9EURO